MFRRKAPDMSSAAGGTEATKKFANAKAISSDMFFNDQEGVSIYFKFYYNRFYLPYPKAIDSRENRGVSSCVA